VRWLADECVHAPVVHALRFEGHDVIYALERGTRTQDTALAEEAFRDARILLTEDKDYGEIVRRMGTQACAAVTFRILPEDRDRKWPQLRAALSAHGEALAKSFTIIQKDRIRSQPYPWHDNRV